MNEKFISWLASGDMTPYHFQSDDDYYVVLRAANGEDFDNLYCQMTNLGQKDRRYASFKYIGIYCKRDGRIYDAREFRLSGILGEYDAFAEDYEYQKLMENLEQSVREKVEAIVGNNRANLKISKLSKKSTINSLYDTMNYCAKGIARARLLGDASPDVFAFHCNYRPKPWTDETICAYIANPDGYATKEADTFWEFQQEEMLCGFLCEDEIRKEYNALVASPEHPIHIIKKIISAMKDVAAKRVVVTIRKDGTELSFKALSKKLKEDCGNKYPAESIVESDREKFRSKFGADSSYSPKEILRITFDNKVLYETRL